MGQSQIVTGHRTPFDATFRPHILSCRLKLTWSEKTQMTSSVVELRKFWLYSDSTVFTWPLALGAGSEALGGQAVEAGQLGLGDHGADDGGLVPEDDGALVDIWSKH